MNFLAHLHIAAHSRSSYLGNFLGDFVKGNPDGKFNEKVVRGIRLHRFVDSYSDQHAINKKLKMLFPQSLRRFAPITLDMFWDHCLAKNWSAYHHASLAEFCQHVERQMTTESQLESNSLPPRFLHVSQAFWQERWSEHYVQIENINFSLQRIASRSARMAPLADTGQILLDNYDLFSQQFLSLYADILQRATEFTAEK